VYYLPRICFLTVYSYFRQYSILYNFFTVESHGTLETRMGLQIGAGFNIRDGKEEPD
jgi:hypothetical protein